jgi:hypothetical protein
VSIPRWPALICLIAVPLLLGSAFWRNSTAYAPGQFMVITNELPREPSAGTPSFEYPPLNHGDIVRSSGTNEEQTHILIESPKTTFWLPANKVQSIW